MEGYVEIYVTVAGVGFTLVAARLSLSLAMLLLSRLRQDFCDTTGESMDCAEANINLDLSKDVRWRN